MRGMRSGSPTSGMLDGEVTGIGVVSRCPKGIAGAIPKFNNAPQRRTVVPWCMIGISFGTS